MGLAIGPTLWLFVQVDAAAPSPAVATPASTAAGVAAPGTVTTPWPVELPCRHPRAIWFDDRLGDTVVWSSPDGGESRTFPAARSRERQRLPRDFPTARLTRLSGPGVGANGSDVLGGVDCAGHLDVTWEHCARGECEVWATYAGGRVPAAKQVTRRWTDPIPGSPWADVAPDVHWTRFLRDVGRKENGDPAAVRESIRFSRAFAIELRDVLAAACGRRRRCAAPAREADRALAAYLRDPSPIHANAAQRRVDNWNYGWSWTATGGSIALRFSCDDMTESPDLLCDLSIDLPGEVVLEYGTFHRDVELYAATDPQRRNRLGGIADVSGDRGPPRTLISGRFLELGDAGPAAK